MRWFRTEAGWRGGAMLLLALALAVRLAAPTGWMLASGDGHGLPRLVICTGHGPLDLGRDAGHPGQAPDKTGDHPCVFAGGAAPTPPPLLAAPEPAAFVAIVGHEPLWLADQQPGRGLAAPPPPSHGPPASLI